MAEGLQALSPSTPLGALKRKPPTLRPFIQGFCVASFSPVSWEGDSMHAVLPEIKAWRTTVPALTAGAVLSVLPVSCFLRPGWKWAL